MKMQTNTERKTICKSDKPNKPYEMPTMGLRSQMAHTLNRLSEQEEEDDDGDYDDDIEEGFEDDVLDNVSKNTTTTSSSFTCYSGPGDSKFNAYKCATDTTTTTTQVSDSLRKRTNAASVKVKSTKSKSVQFRASPEQRAGSPYSTNYVPAELNVHRTKPLKKIIFNGTFPIDDPYSSRF